MKSILVKWSVNIISLLLVVYFMPGIELDKWQTAVIATVALTLVNTFLKPIILLLTLPFNILSLGLFTFLINGLLFYLVSKIVTGFNILTFWDAFWGALIFSIISFFLNLFTNIHSNMRFGFHRYSRKYENIIDTDIEEEDK